MIECDPRQRFVDEMLEGAFKTLRHLHEFEPSGTSTLMRDTLTWTSPMGIFGRIADWLFLERHMRAFLTDKQHRLKELAEALAAD